MADSELLTDWERKRQEYKQRKRLGGSREKETLQRLARFQEQLKSKAKAAAAAEADAERAQRGAADADAGGQLQGAERGQVAGEAGYSGKVREDIDHRAYMPGEAAHGRAAAGAGLVVPLARGILAGVPTVPAVQESAHPGSLANPEGRCLPRVTCPQRAAGSPPVPSTRC